ncbi:unnamed protein product [Linum tenue]|uniref:Uncharacterized protein n=1 Tax=Linum tenue TaxID=586396 RepID=A0AAV0NE55_9ROSI|nr:unnamed protein product [Linum tenue]
MGATILEKPFLCRNDGDWTFKIYKCIHPAVSNCTNPSTSFRRTGMSIGFSPVLPSSKLQGISPNSLGF